MPQIDHQELQDPPKQQRPHSDSNQPPNWVSNEAVGWVWEHLLLCDTLYGRRDKKTPNNPITIPKNEMVHFRSIFQDPPDPLIGTAAIYPDKAFPGPSSFQRKRMGVWFPELLYSSLMLEFNHKPPCPNRCEKHDVIELRQNLMHHLQEHVYKYDNDLVSQYRAYMAKINCFEERGYLNGVGVQHYFAEEFGFFVATMFQIPICILDMTDDLGIGRFYLPMFQLDVEPRYLPLQENPQPVTLVYKGGHFQCGLLKPNSPLPPISLPSADTNVDFRFQSFWIDRYYQRIHRWTNEAPPMTLDLHTIHAIVPPNLYRVGF